MAARYAKITIRASWSLNSFRRGEQTEEVRFQLAGQWVAYRRGGQPSEFVVPNPTTNNGAYTPDYMLDGVGNLLALVRATIASRGLFYTVQAASFVGDILGDAGSMQPQVEFAIEANTYDPTYNLAFSVLHDPYLPRGWEVVSNLTTIRPLVVSQVVVNAGIYGTATGNATLSADGNGPAYTYVWADGPTGDYRPNMAAGTYFCTVTDSLGESVRVTVVVKSDPRLEVQVNTTPNSCELVPSGGLPPYAYAWADGATTALRTGLAVGTYHCVVSDARGATRDVDVEISNNTRYWFSGNPIVLSLDAGQAYRDDPTTKPNLSFVCEVWVEQVYLSNVFTPLGQALEQPADAGGRTTFEVQELLEPFVAPVLPTLRPGIRRDDGVFTRFFLKHFERDTLTGDGQATTVQVNYLVHGGLGYYEAAVGTWFRNYQPRRLPFLTWEPTTKKVLPDQPEYLYFMALDTLSAFQYCLRLTWADGSQTSSVLATGPAALAYELFCLAAGPDQLDLPGKELAAGKLVERYELFVLGPTDDLLSEVRTYVLDRRPCRVRRYFLYANSLGGWNTLVCRGDASLDVATKTSATENARPAGYNPLLGDYTTNRRTGLPTLHCYTGARSSEQLLADQDFLLSERVVLLKDGRYLAGQVKDRTVTVLDEDETRRVVQFDFELPRERYHTPQL